MPHSSSLSHFSVPACIIKQRSHYPDLKKPAISIAGLAVAKDYAIGSLRTSRSVQTIFVRYAAQSIGDAELYDSSIGELFLLTYTCSVIPCSKPLYASFMLGQAVDRSAGRTSKIGLVRFKNRPAILLLYLSLLKATCCSPLTLAQRISADTAAKRKRLITNNERIYPWKKRIKM